MINQRFAGKVALITGGGSGIGAETARRIAAEGGKVVVTGRRLAPIAAVAEEIGGAALAGDTTDLDHLKAAVALGVERFGGIDVLVANAGIESFGSAVQMSLDDWRRTLQVNIDGAMLASRAAIPEMQRRGGGAIVLVSSLAGLAGVPSYTAYMTSKTALIGLGRSLAVDYGRQRIRANVICPALVHTEMTLRAFEGFARHRGCTADALMQQFVRFYPLGRAGTVAELAGSIAFLASDDAGFITGTVLTADGGASAVDISPLGLGPDTGPPPKETP
jgi:meso-butanediol dehydrogenase / (S,S)-butanediol dehydrogenase / diacetyl reductase